ncbi:MAG TPA: DUF4233 domain-containing protein [Candidatus Nanopelagicaceae bacterium]
MRVLGSAVLAMESLVMGFALLLAMEKHGVLALSLGGALAIAILLTAGAMKHITGWYLGSIWQICLIGYGVVVPAMYFMGTLFAVLWVCAFYIGRKGEAIRADLLANPPPE